MGDKKSAEREFYQNGHEKNEADHRESDQYIYIKFDELFFENFRRHQSGRKNYKLQSYGTYKKGNSKIDQLQ